MIKGPKLRLKAIAPRMAQKTLRELSQEFLSAKPKILISTQKTRRRKPKKQLIVTEKLEPESKKLRFELSYKDEKLKYLHAEHDKLDGTIEKLLDKLGSVHNILNSNIPNFPEINSK